MMKHLTVAIFCSYVGLAWTHHSIDADFTPGVSITISAVTKEFSFTNPHPFLTATALTDEGEGKDWMLLPARRPASPALRSNRAMSSS